MRAEKMNQRQRIARLEKVSSMNYIRISKLEELVAELGAAMGGALLGIPYEGLQHESYIKSWLKSLKDDPRHIVKAAKQASKAVQYLDENGSTDLLEQAE